MPTGSGRILELPQLDPFAPLPGLAPAQHFFGDDTMTTTMTATRERVQVDAAIMATIGPILLYAQASDGVWVPKCDLAQYEAGRRPWAS
jgi:hypothetical protein